MDKRQFSNSIENAMLASKRRTEIAKLEKSEVYDNGVVSYTVGAKSVAVSSSTGTRWGTAVLNRSDHMKKLRDGMIAICKKEGIK
jgi:hypothetical protein